LNKAGVVLDGRPGWDMWPVCLSTSVAFCINPPMTVHGSFWGSKEIDSPGLVVGGVWEGRRMADSLLTRPSGHWGQGPQTLRMRWISVGIRVLYSEREISAEFMVGRVSAGDVEVNRF
jgi:hypothetical protein